MQRVAFNVCEDIYGILSDTFGCAECQVTVFQQFYENNKHYIRMIAYKTYKDRVPGSYSEKYDLWNDDSEKKPLHIRIFEKGTSAIIALCNSEQVKEEFVYHEKSKEREEKICQYLGIPLLDSEGRMIFLLQIDVCDSGILGKNKEEMIELGNNIMVPYIQLLYATYEHERSIETFQQCMHISSKKESVNSTKEA